MGASKPEWAEVNDHATLEEVFRSRSFGQPIPEVPARPVLPEAVTASEKLEMRGEKVDLESIKNTIKSDLENFKGRAKEMGTEMKDRFQYVGEEMKKGSQQFAAEAAPIARSARHGIGHAIHEALN